MTAYIDPYRFGVPVTLPQSLANCEQYLAADVLALANGAPVTSWLDQSGNARHTSVDGANPGTEPIFVTGAKNGKPAIDFSTTGGVPPAGVTKYFFQPSNFMSGKTDGEMFIVMKWKGGTNAEFNTFSATQAGYYPASSTGWFNEAFGRGSVINSIVPLVNPGLDYYLYNVSSIVGDYTVRQNNNVMHNVVGNSPMFGPPSSTLRLGAATGLGSALLILEIVFYSGTRKTAGERDQLIAFWNNKYGMAI